MANICSCCLYEWVTFKPADSMRSKPTKSKISQQIQPSAAWWSIEASSSLPVLLYSFSFWSYSKEDEWRPLLGRMSPYWKKEKNKNKNQRAFHSGIFFLTQWKTECLLSGTDFGILLVCRVSVKQRTTSPLCATNCEVIGAMDGDRELDMVLSDRIKSPMWSHCVTVQSRRHSPGCMM